MNVISNLTVFLVTFWAACGEFVREALLFALESLIVAVEAWFSSMSGLDPLFDFVGGFEAFIESFQTLTNLTGPWLSGIIPVSGLIQIAVTGVTAIVGIRIARHIASLIPTLNAG